MGPSMPAGGLSEIEFLLLRFSSTFGPWVPLQRKLYSVRYGRLGRGHNSRANQIVCEYAV